MRMTRTTRPAALLALACAALLARPTAAQPDVTSAGFDKLVAGATFYAEVPMRGALGENATAQGVYQTLKAAARDDYVRHAVFMVDSPGGELMDREIVGRFDGDLEITAVVSMGLSTAAFPVFFADHIYLTDDGLLGGLALATFLDHGDDNVTAKQVGIFTNMLASAAESRGHHPDIARAMLNDKLDLYFWRESNEVRLSNTSPPSPELLADFRKVRSVLPGSTLVVDQELAEEIGLASPIDDFDAFIVGEYLGEPNWLPANHFGRVANEIGSVVAELEPLRDSLAEFEKQLPDIRGRDDIPEHLLREFNAWKRSMEGVVDTIDLINNALEELYNVHPERHTYFTGPGNQTILASSDQWAEDVREANKYLGQANGGLRQLESDYPKIGGDPEELYDLIQRMRVITGHFQGIQRYGNAAYWAEHAEPELPDDIYG